MLSGWNDGCGNEKQIPKQSKRLLTGSFVVEQFGAAASGSSDVEHKLQLLLWQRSSHECQPLICVMKMFVAL